MMIWYCFSDTLNNSWSWKFELWAIQGRCKYSSI